ncbi:hypothetical protein Tco_1198350 [Tanacetum coccineum]
MDYVFQQLIAIGRMIDGIRRGLQVKQKEDGIFISQDKYVTEILKKFGFSDVKTASTPMETHKPLLKDTDGEDIDEHMYRSMIGSLMYLTSSRPDIMFTCKKKTVVANSTIEAEYVAASSYCGQVLWIQNQLLDYGDSNEKKLIQMIKIHTDKNIADLLTKAFDLGCLSTISGLALIGQSSALDKPNLSVEGYASALAEHPAGVYFGWAKLSTRGFYKMAMSIGVVYASLCRWILKDRPEWFRDCRVVDALDVLLTTNGGTIELLHMPALRQVWSMMGIDGMDGVTILVNSSTEKLMPGIESFAFTFEQVR